MNWQEQQPDIGATEPPVTNVNAAPTAAPKANAVSGVRRGVMTMAIAAGLLLVGGGVAMAASPDPSASAAPSATSQPGGVTTPNGTATPGTHAKGNCPAGANGSGSTSGSGGTTAPATDAPSTDAASGSNA